MFEIGNSLREARLRQGLEFPEIEQATKIRGKYLRALEEESFDVLPAQTYVKGFLRSYADYLGLDGQLYVDEFNSRYVRGELEDEEEQRPYRPRVSSPSRGGAFQNKAVLLTVAVIVVLTMFVFAAFRWGGSDKQPELLPLTKHAAGEEGRQEAGGEARRGRHQRRRLRRRLPRGAHGAADLRGDARERQEAALRGTPPLGLRLRARQPPAQAERPRAPGAGSGDRVRRRWLEVTPTRVIGSPRRSA